MSGIAERAPARRRRGIGRARGRSRPDARRPRLLRTGGRRASAPRSARAPCSRASRESTVIFGPIDQVGCASASSTVTSASSARVRPRNGPPDAVSTTECTARGARPSRHWKSAECSLSTGRSAPAAALPRGERELAGRDEALLVRERERDAALERPERRADAGEADDGVEHDVRLGPLEQLGRVAADLRQRRRSAARSSVEPDAAATSSSAGVARRRSRAPAGRSIRSRPSSATRRHGAVNRSRRPGSRRARAGPAKSSESMPVEHAAVARRGGARSPSRRSRA